MQLYLIFTIFNECICLFNSYPVPFTNKILSILESFDSMKSIHGTVAVIPIIVLVIRARSSMAK